MAEEIDRYYYERTAAEHGFECVCGIDEAGRGPLAGPVFAAAVILPKDYIIEGLNDSKKLSEKKRDLLFDEIKEHAVYAVASASVEEIDEMNILNATFLAMRRAFEALPERPQAASLASVNLNEPSPACVLWTATACRVCPCRRRPLSKATP